MDPVAALPAHVLACVLGQCAGSDVARLSRVSRRWRDALGAPALWALMLARAFPHAPAARVDLLASPHRASRGGHPRAVYAALARSAPVDVEFDVVTALASCVWHVAAYGVGGERTGLPETYGKDGRPSARGDARAVVHEDSCYRDADGRAAGVRLTLTLPPGRYALVVDGFAERARGAASRGHSPPPLGFERTRGGLSGSIRCAARGWAIDVEASAVQVDFAV